MSKKGSIFLTKRSLVTTFTISFLIGLVCAVIVSREENAYAAGTAFSWIILSVLCPLIVILLISAILAALIYEFKATTLLLISCFLIPILFVCFVKFLEMTKISVYAREGANQVKTINSE